MDLCTHSPFSGVGPGPCGLAQDSNVLCSISQSVCHVASDGEENAELRNAAFGASFQAGKVLNEVENELVDCLSLSEDEADEFHDRARGPHLVWRHVCRGKVEASCAAAVPAERGGSRKSGVPHVCRANAAAANIEPPLDSSGISTASTETLLF